MAPSIAPRLMPLRAVVAALMGSCLLYAVVLQMLSAQWVDAEPADLGFMPMALSAVAVGTAVLIPVLRKVMMGSLAIFPPDVLRVQERVEPAELNMALSRASGRYFTGTIVGCALAEAVVLYGFTLAYLSHEPMDILPFMVVGLGLMAVQFPRVAGLVSLLSAPELATWDERWG